MRIAIHIRMLLTPEISEARERELAIAEVNIPSVRQLEAVGRLVATQVLIHRCEGEPLREIRLVPSVGDTRQVGILNVFDATIILDVPGERRFPKAQFSGDFLVGRLHLTIAIIHINKEKGTTPLIRLEHFHRRSQLRASG